MSTPVSMIVYMLSIMVLGTVIIFTIVKLHYQKLKICRFETELESLQQLIVKKEFVQPRRRPASVEDEALLVQTMEVEM
jgi:hypothetical protein|tara:strand:- start:5528 stop:5764 length:237 start_codon:yes stop_codon:yes gene_type:complete